MFLKLRIPFFKDFDKKTLRMLMDRIYCSHYKRHDCVVEFKKPQDQLCVLLSGRLARYDKKKFYVIDKESKVDGYVDTLQDIGKEGMTEF